MDRNRRCVRFRLRSRGRVVPVFCYDTVSDFVWANLGIGDEVAVVARWFSKHQKYRLVAAKVVPDYPVLADLSGKFVRIRADLWSRITMLLQGGDIPAIPSATRKALLRRFAKATGVDDDGDQPGTAEFAEPQPPEFS